MENTFKIEIISPEKIIFSGDSESVTIPAYEGDMNLLKNHISTITFLRPGIIKVKKKTEDFENFFVEDGTVEYFNDKLVILSSSAINIKDISKEFIEKLKKEIEEKLNNKDLVDHDRYILNHKLSTIEELRI